ncbi:lipid-transfer protein [Shewanella ulleungensis]|uniref:Lipid-transfer protein Ltp1 n=1 Tax=Shewanella ulleungensis TaxID=2282699 RepID=A0ABQ2QGP0_9GAMM|nr:lipid-transfer protein [Shewanella ulleungensis]MCL1149450.1 lipid-transfer protein [Shewanella ulleungensis]GGP79181.1 putative lipid-transfer protein Ltp1 [Shewanella ulleungensis]
MTTVRVAGVGMIPFCKPGQQQPYRVMAAEAIKLAIADAGINAKAIGQAYGAYIYGDSTCAQHAFYDVIQSGIPVINVNNNCSSGSTALFLARQAVLSGQVECALAFGFEEMQPGALGSHWQDRESPFERLDPVLQQFNAPQGPIALRAFGAAGRHYMDKYHINADIFAKVAEKSRRHAINNPYSMFSTPLAYQQVLDDKVIYDNYLTRLMACPPTCGAAATIVCSEQFARQHGITSKVKIIAQAMATDTELSWQDPINAVGKGMTQQTAEQVYCDAGIGPRDIDVIELHDCFTPNEVITYEALGLCPEGEAAQLIADGDNTYGGRYVIGPSGGLMSKGHPIGATGLAQCTELTWHLRGQAGKRQVDNARLALQHNVGLGGAVVVTLYGA